MGDTTTSNSCLSELVQDESHLWKLYAPSYSRVLPQVSFYRDSVDRMAGSVNGLMHILDLGCGPGILSQKLAEAGHEITAVDNDGTMLDFATERLTKFSRVRIQREDATALSLKSESIDGVVCNNVLYYVNDPFGLVSEAHRVLKERGIFSVSGPTRTFDRRVLDLQMEKELKERGLYESLAGNIDTIKRCNSIIAAQCIRNPFDIPELEAMLRKAGFTAIADSRLIYLGQCYFISAVKGTFRDVNLLNHEIVTKNVIVGKKLEVPVQFKKTVIGDYEFYVAATPQEMVEILRLRYKAYTREGLIEHNPECPFDFDVFDKNAVLVYARNRITGKIEATNRLILDSEMGLYSERTFDFNSLRSPDKVLAEGSRLAADPPRQKARINDMEVSIMDLVLDKTTEFAKYIGVTHIMGLARVKRSLLFERSGFYPVADIKNVHLRDGKINSGMDFYPVVLDVNKVFYERIANQFK